MINIPFFFVFEPQKEIIFVDKVTNQTEYLYKYGESDFALSQNGKVLKNVVYFFRDILTLFILIVVNIVSVILFRNIYYNRDSKILKTLAAKRRNSLLMVNFMSSLEAAPSNPDSSRQELLKYRRNMRTRFYFSVSQANKMLTKMVLIICVLSTIEHTFITLGLQLFSSAYSKSFKFFVLFLSNVSTVLKHSINILIFYNCNRFFRIRFLNKISSLIRWNKNV